MVYKIKFCVKIIKINKNQIYKIVDQGQLLKINIYNNINKKLNKIYFS